MIALSPGRALMLANLAKTLAEFEARAAETRKRADIARVEAVREEIARVEAGGL